MVNKKNFQDVSSDYDSSRSSGFLGKHVNKERKLVLEFLNPKKNDVILDAGCGTGFYSLYSRSKGASVIGIDSSQTAISVYNSKGLNGFIGDIENISFDKQFNKILCAGALEFTKNPSKAISCFSKSLKKNGIIVLVYPRNNFFGILYKLYHLSGLYFIPYGKLKLSKPVNIHLFSNNKISSLMENNGFKIINDVKANVLTNVLVAVK
ncbi:MAG: class I SAM-dependent methyltransferase, partial [Nanoarchaeota archaeon]